MALVPCYDTTERQLRSSADRITPDEKFRHSPLLVVIVCVLIVGVFAIFQQPTFPRFVSDRERSSKTPPKVLLMSYDGFRWDYISRSNGGTPTFDRLIKDGVWVSGGLKNTFITITAPNHYGLATGLYEESHGIVANSFFNPILNETFDYFTTKSKTDPRFFGGEPIWVTNQRQASERRSGCVMWVGCDVKIKGHLPSHFMSFNTAFSWRKRVDKVVNWLSDSHNPVNLGILYVEEPDITGHKFGPETPEVQAMVRELDGLTSYLLDRLSAVGLSDSVNIILTADHGMASVPWKQAVNIDSYVPPSWYTNFGATPDWNILPQPGKEDAIVTRLSSAPHLKVFRKSDLPERFHYRDSPSVMPLQLYAQLHWRLANNESTLNLDEPKWVPLKIGATTHLFRIESPNDTLGNHGYDNELPEMHPYFIGVGPAFKKGYNATETIESVDIYTLMCHILAIKEAPNNGSFARVKNLLRCNPYDEQCKLNQIEAHHPRSGNFPEQFSNRGHLADLFTMAIMCAIILCFVFYFFPSSGAEKETNFEKLPY